MTGAMTRARGFTLMSAIFILVILATLGVYMVRIGTVQQATGILTLGQARAYYAAQSGLEWAMFRALQLDSCANGSFNLTEAQLAGFSITVTCAQTTHRVRNEDVRYYRLDVTAERGTFGQTEYVSRAVSATVGDAP